MDNENFGVLVFTTTQNKPKKVFIGDDSVTFSMPNSLIKCDLERQGVISEIVCDSRSNLGIKLNDKVTIEIRRKRNQVVLYIKAHKTIHVLTEKNHNKQLTG
jgi:hypothetical protein